ncbi:MAG: STAS domain-containing protein [Planctomycetaceae bacterium]|nr:STAS domain-containing protein [Planctomycetaceae bacterium]
MMNATWDSVNTFGDQTSEELRKLNHPAFVVDLTPLTYLGSSAVAMLVRLWKDVRTQGGKMAVICTHPVVLEVLTIASLDKVWNIVGTSEKAQQIVAVPVSLSHQEAERGVTRPTPPASIWRRIPIVAWGFLVLSALAAIVGFLLMNAPN